MADKCFCHLNGYKVKDADARKEIEEIKSLLESSGEVDIGRFEQIDNEIEQIDNEIEALQSKDIELSVVSRETLFNSEVMYYNYSNGLEMFIIENYENESGIDNTKDDGEYILVNNYSKSLHCITVPDGSIKMFRSTTIPSSKSFDAVFAHVDKEGEGTIDVYISSDGGTTFNLIEQDALVPCDKGTQFVVQLKLTGNVTLHNLCWGVKAR